MNEEPEEDDFSTIQLVEEAVALLRRSPASTIVAYYVGAIPFWLNLLFFVSDMSLYGLARDRLVGASFLLAFLFLWSKCWTTEFPRTTCTSSDFPLSTVPILLRRR